MAVEHQTATSEDRAVEIQLRLAEQGHHRAASAPDLLVGVTAELMGLTILHDDTDVDLIASITGQPVERRTGP